MGRKKLVGTRVCLGTIFYQEKSAKVSFQMGVCTEGRGKDKYVSRSVFQAEKTAYA
jgi:hypothetical protein